MFCNILRETLVLESLFDKIADLQASNFRAATFSKN